MNAPIIETPIRLTLTRSFDATPERLFDAFTSRDFGLWLGVEGMTCLSCETDPRAGGKWSMRHRTPDGDELEHHGVYKEVSRPTRLAFTWSGGCGGAQVTLVTVSVKAKGAGAEMTLTDEGFVTIEDTERHEGGWAGSFARLARYLAG